MTREEAIQILKRTIAYESDFAEAIDMAIEALQAKTEGDLISRQDAVNAVLGITMYQGRVPVDTVMYRIGKIPSAEPKQGEWMLLEYEFLTCSECGDDHWTGCESTAEARERLKSGDYPNYCSNCGAKMKGGEKE